MSSSTHIGQLLGQLVLIHPRTGIKGLGTFQASYQSATIDYVQGQIHPPGRSLEFLGGTIHPADDCTMHYAALAGVDDIKATEDISSWTRDTLERLYHKQLVILPGVGRLFSDANGQVQFVAERVRMEEVGFGLPVLNYYPILREKQAYVHKVQQEKTLQQDAEKYVAPVELEARNNSMWLQRWLPLGLAACMALVIGVAIYQNQQKLQGQGTADRVPVNQPRINQAPSAIFPQEALGLPATPVPPPPAIPAPAEPEEKDGDEATAPVTKNTPAPKKADKAIQQDKDAESDEEIVAAGVPSTPKQEAIVIIGAFSKKQGMQVYEKKIYSLGYQPYHDRKNGLYRVGAKVPYTHNSELPGKLQWFRNKVDAEAFFLK